MKELDCYGNEIELHPDDNGEQSVYSIYLLARWCYLMGEPYLSDPEYDKLEKVFQAWYPNDIHTKHGWSFDKCPEALLRKYGKSELICNPVMGYMAESISSVNTDSDVEMTFRNLSKKSRLSFKIDGWNTRVSYFKGHLVNIQTRGRSGNNLDIRHVAKLFPKTIPYKGRVAITGEMSIPNSQWPTVKAMTGNSDQRASIRTLLANNNVDYLSFLAFNIFSDENEITGDPYEVLQSIGFKTPRFVWVDSYQRLQEGIRYMSYLDRGYDYLTDGLVIENDSIQLAIRIGAWEEFNMYSYVTGYEEDPGMYGTFFKILCKPITNEGKTFGKISINNISTIIENNLQIGYPIAFSLRSAANVVIDVLATKSLQAKYAGRYEDYRNDIDRRINQ